jgi:UDP-3-O-[3-hydroxymyristoyl] N-acetylglucosamine deacetylase/3-hydroxyacyl-[acyl-carrier-protein] dehydratase
MERQRTIKKEVSRSGIGVHTGNRTSITFKPAPPGYGVRFLGKEFPEEPPIEAVIENVVDILRGTTLGRNGVKIHTVEHVLAVLMGLGIDNLLVEVEGNEPPVGDGSALPFVEMIRTAGIELQDAPKNVFRPKEAIYFSENGVDLVVLPAAELTISFTISYSEPGIDTQFLSLAITDETFIKEIAPSRTFCPYHEVEDLIVSGLIQGGSLDNAVVVDGDVVLSKEGLRFEKEFVRHKILDLMGDLFLLGQPLRAHVVAIKSGHASNIKLTSLLRQKAQMEAKKSGRQTEEGLNLNSFEIAEIMKIFPHRYPFLLVDKIVEFVPDKKVVGIKNVTINEPFFQGHFPGHPVMPGVLIVEAMAQVAGMIMLTKGENVGKVPYFMSINKVKFRKPVFPGDTLRLEAEAVRLRTTTCLLKTSAFVGETIVCQAELMCSLVDVDADTRRSIAGEVGRSKEEN